MENILYSFVGGLLIGLGATILLFFEGRILGVSGILNGALSGLKKGANEWRFRFMLGLISGGVIMKSFRGSFDFKLNSSMLEIIIAGLLVGYGTLIGSGCTSGHGVCGLPRFSARSLIATLTFIAAGMITVYIKGKL